MQHVFDTSNFSLKYVKYVLGLFTRLCIFCNLISLIWSKILIKLTREPDGPERSPDLLNNVKIGQDQLQLIMKHILFYGGCGLVE